MSIELNGTIALVTGANRGIGKAIVEALLAAGAAKVYAAVRRVESAQELAEQSGGRVVPIEVDLSKPATIAAAAQQATDVQIVINNAGVLTITSPLEPGFEKNFQYEIDVNVYGLLHVAQAFAPVLKANGGGALVQLNSVASLKNFADFATYSASKAASYSLTQGLRDKLAEQGTRVISVHPGPIATDMGNSAGLGDIAEPVTKVSDALIEALRGDAFHVFPDTMAQQFWAAYEGFGKNVVEATVSEGETAGA